MKRTAYNPVLLPGALGTLLLLTLIYGSAFAVRDYQAQTARVLKELADTAEGISRHTQHYLLGYANLFTALAQTPCVIARDPASCNPFLARLNQRFPTLVNFAALDAQGRFFASGRAFDPEDPPRGEHFPFFQVLRDGASHFVMNPHRGPISGRTVTGVVVPLTDDRGRFAGVIGGSMALDELQNLWHEDFDRTDHRVLVIDRNRQVIATSPNLAHWLEQPSSALGNLDTLLADTAGLLHLDEERYQLQLAEIPISQWQVVALTPQAVTLGAYLNHQPWVGILGLALLGLMLLTVLLLYRDRRWFARLLSKDRELGRRNRQMERANRELEAFSYAVSHDLRAPLRRIEGFSRALEQAIELPPGPRHYLTRIQAGIGRMEELIEGLLRLSHVERQPLQCSLLNLSSLFEQAARRLEGAAHARIDIAPDLTAWGDPGLITLVVDNLLNNALKYSAQEREPCIRVGQDVGTSAFFIADNGVGFAMNRAQRLFSPFERLHSESQFQGIGVGLNTVRRVIERHGGRIWAEASPGLGATFYFTLPDPS